MTLALAYTGGVSTASSYVIVPCGETSQLTVNYGSATDSVNGLVMRSTAGSWGWTSGHAITQIVSPNSSAAAGIQVAWNGYGPHATVPNLYTALNLGYVQADTGLLIAGSPLSSTVAGFSHGIRLGESSQQSQIAESGISMSGVGLELDTSATAIPGGNWGPPGTTGDPKAIVWPGDSAHDQVWIYPGAPGAGLVINDPAGPKLTIANDIYTAATLNFSQAGGSTYTFPPTAARYSRPKVEREWSATCRPMLPRPSISAP